MLLDKDPGGNRYVLQVLNQYLSRLPCLFFPALVPSSRNGHSVLSFHTVSSTCSLVAEHIPALNQSCPQHIFYQ